jgi:hypothetical protein
LCCCFVFKRENNFAEFFPASETKAVDAVAGAPVAVVIKAAGLFEDAAYEVDVLCHTRTLEQVQASSKHTTKDELPPLNTEITNGKMRKFLSMCSLRYLVAKLSFGISVL